MNVFETIAHQFHTEWIFVSALFAAGILILAGLSVKRAVAGENGGVMPDEGVSIRNVVEVIIQALGDLGETTIGNDWRRYFPIVGTIFFFVLVSNIMSLIPGLLGSTSDANVTFAWAIISGLRSTASMRATCGMTALAKFPVPHPASKMVIPPRGFGAPEKQPTMVSHPPGRRVLS